jgi:hypothetical protein
VFLGAKGLNVKGIHKEIVSVYGGKCLPLKEVHNRVANVPLMKRKSSACHLLSRCYLVGFFFDPEDRGDVLLKRRGDFEQTSRRYIPEDRTFHNHRCENLKFYDNLYFLKYYILVGLYFNIYGTQWQQFPRSSFNNQLRINHIRPQRNI